GRENGDAEAGAYEAGEADFSLRGAVGFAGHEPKHPTGALEGPATILAYLAFGRAHAEVTGDVDFRRAVSLALGRAALRHLGSGERVIPALAPASPDLGGPTPGPEEAAAPVAAAPAALRPARAPAPARRARGPARASSAAPAPTTPRSPRASSPRSTSSASP